MHFLAYRLCTQLLQCIRHIFVFISDFLTYRRRLDYTARYWDRSWIQNYNQVYENGIDLCSSVSPVFHEISELLILKWRFQCTCTIPNTNTNTKSIRRGSGIRDFCRFNLTITLLFVWIMLRYLLGVHFSNTITFHTKKAENCA